VAVTDPLLSGSVECIGAARETIADTFNKVSLSFMAGVMAPGKHYDVVAFGDDGIGALVRFKA